MIPLPHQTDLRYLVWTGLETELIFNKGIDLPGFASFPLLEEAETRTLLADYARKQIALASRFDLGTILESTTWLANKDRAASLGYDATQLIAVNRDAIRFLASVRDQSEQPDILISANIGPRHDAYAPADTMTPSDAETYHQAQIQSLIGTPLDMLSAYTLTYCDEAIGIARAAATAEIPCVIAFTVETDGALPNGQTFDDAIAQTDAETGQSVAYYMVNCAHPDHFSTHLNSHPRLKGVVVNASRCSHAELDEATELDDGDPAELGQLVAGMIHANPALNVFGGCCGTDMRHLTAMAENVSALS